MLKRKRLGKNKDIEKELERFLEIIKKGRRLLEVRDIKISGKDFVNKLIHL